MKCSICTAKMEYSFTAKVMYKYSADYFLCNACGYLAVQNPGWLEEAYLHPISPADTGLMTRNNSLSLKVACVLFFLANERGEGTYLDIAGGYGLFTRLMRDLGFNFLWMDKFCENIISPGFEFQQDMNTCQGVTAFEVLEHLVDPVTFIEEALDMSGANLFVFSTDLFTGAPPFPEDWYFYAFATGQHIAFYQRRTLEILGNRLGMFFASANGIHIFSKTKISERYLNLVTGNLLSASSLVVKCCMKPKTLNDHLLMMEKICKQDNP